MRTTIDQPTQETATSAEELFLQNEPLSAALRLQAEHFLEHVARFASGISELLGWAQNEEQLADVAPAMQEPELTHGLEIAVPREVQNEQPLRLDETIQVNPEEAALPLPAEPQGAPREGEHLTPPATQARTARMRSAR